MRTAEEIAERARGEYKSKYINQTNSVEAPIIERLSSDEQLHFVFFNSDTGLKIFTPDSEKRTPDSTDSLTEVLRSQGKRFLLITDKRILYIVGKKKESDDELQVFEYDQITSAEVGSHNMVIEFSTTDGRRYEFNTEIDWGSDIENAAKYISSQIDSNTAEGSEERAQEDTPEPDPEQVTPDSPGTKFCPDCGAEVEVNNTFCTECGTSLDSEGKDQTEHFENRSSSGGSTESSTGGGGWQSQYSTLVWITSGIVGLITFPFGLLVPAYFYFKASRGNGSSQSTAEIVTVILFNVLGMLVVEFIGVKYIRAFIQWGILALIIWGIVSLL